MTVATCVFVPLYEFDTERDCDGIGVLDGVDEPIMLILTVLLNVLVSTAVCDLLTDILAISDRLTDWVNDVDRDTDVDKDMLLDSDGDRVILRDVVTDTDIVGGTLREPLGVGCTDNEGVILNPNDAEREGLAWFEG